MELRMSQKELDRLKLGKAKERERLSQKEASRLMGLSACQVRRIARRCGHEGDAGLAHPLRERESNRKIPSSAEGIHSNAGNEKNAPRGVDGVEPA